MPGSIVGDERAAERYTIGRPNVTFGRREKHRGGICRTKAFGENGHARVPGSRAMFLVDDGNVEICWVPDGVGRQIQSFRIPNRDRFHRTVAANIKCLDAISLWMNLIAPVGITKEGVGAQPLGILK